MTLSELIEEFKEATGRIDLSVAEATKYLNRGCKFLDEITFKVQEDAMHFALISAETTGVVIHRTVRAIKSVWAYTDTERFELAYLPLGDMRKLYKDFTSSSGIPTHYSPSPVRLVATNENNQQGDIPGVWADFPGSVDTVREAIMIWPRPDIDYSLEILGNFYTESLSSETVENWWSVRHPELVIQAAIYRMDNNYRNTNGGKELLESLPLGAQTIYFDEIENESNRSSIMKG